MNLYKNKISDITPLSTITKLNELYLGENEIRDIKALSTLSNLKKLTLEINEISDISSLSKLTNLEYLNLYKNKISDITPISALTNLNELYLSTNEISDITPVSTLTNLTKLSFASNQVSDISVLSTMTNLSELSLGKNEISDITPLSTLTNLTLLQLQGNRITDISILEGKNIANLNIKNQKISVQVEERGEIKLPNIFIQAKNKNSVAYSDDELKLEGCTLNSDETAITLNSDVINAKVTLFKDSDDRKGVADSEFIVELKDDVAPTIEVNYSTTILTNTNVTVTIVANEPIQEVTGWKLSSDRLKLTKEYTQNGQEEVVIKDIAGNERKIQVEVSNIDKKLLEAEVRYKPTEITKGTVTVEIKANEKIQQVEGWILAEDGVTLTKVYAQNQKEEVIIKDLAGNEIKVNVEVGNIDKVAPQAEMKYNTTEATNTKVTVTIVANEPIQEVTGWTLSSDKLTLTKEYTGNVKEEIVIKDLVGNERVIPVEISNIDIAKPEAEVEYSTKEITRETVKVTIKTNEKIQQIEGWTLGEDGVTLTKIYTQNGQEEVVIKDIAGNEIKVNISVSNIDIMPPKVGVKYSTTNKMTDKVIVTLTADEEIQEVEGWTISSDKLTLTKVYTKNVEEQITVYDTVGNGTRISVKVNNIEKENQQEQQKEDNTIAGGQIPQAGQSLIVIISILTILLVGIVSYIKLKRFKDVK